MAPRRQGEYPTQAPQTTESEQPVENPGHIEQFDYRQTPITDVPEEKLLGGIPHSTSDELTEELKSPARFRENPIDTGTTTTDDKLSIRDRYKRISRKQKALAMIAAGTAGAVIGVISAGGASLGGGKYVETEDGMLVPENIATAPMVPGETNSGSEQPLDPATTNPEVFKAQPLEAILLTTVPVLDAERENSINEINEYLKTNPLYVPLKTRDEIVPAVDDPMLVEETRRAQDRERIINADTHTISEIAQSNPDYAKNLTLAVFKEGTAAYEAFIKQIDPAQSNGNVTVRNPSSGAVSSSGALLSGKVGSHYITPDAPAHIALVDDYDHPIVDDTGIKYPLFNRVTATFTYDDNKTRDIVVQTLQDGDPGFVLYPEERK